MICGVESVCVYTRGAVELYSLHEPIKRKPPLRAIWRPNDNIRQSSARLENYLFPHLCSKMDFSHATGMHLRVPWQKKLRYNGSSHILN